MSKELVRSESSIEGSFVRQVRKVKGLVTRKMNGEGYRGWCDRLVLGPLKFARWIEFKRPGGHLTPLQQDHHDTLRELGWEPQVFEDADEAFNYVMNELEEHMVAMKVSKR